MNRRQFIASASSASAALTLGGCNQSDQIILKMNLLSGENSFEYQHVYQPWIDAIYARSSGRLKIESYASLGLGGKPAQMFNQAKSGNADIIVGLPGYSIGQFPRSEVFELPFMMSHPEAASQALCQMIEDDFSKNEYADWKILSAYTHGAGTLHMLDPIRKLADMKSRLVRTPTRLIYLMLLELGAEPVGMPFTEIIEAVKSKNIDGTVLPFDVTKETGLSTYLNHHTEFSSDHALYTAPLVMAMNKEKYEFLDQELKDILDEECGMKFAKFAGAQTKNSNNAARLEIIETGGEVILLDHQETEKWRKKASNVYNIWHEEMSAKGLEGNALLKQATKLIEQYS